MILEEIKAKLEEIDPHVFYGMVDSNDQDVQKVWNYIVFSRKSLSYSDTKKGYTDRFNVAIIRENFIPEGLEFDVINKMLEISGMRLANPDSQYNYTLKPNTNTVVELLTMEFVKPRKRVDA